jgi:membrane-bound lytic murein transglycosylase B
MTPAQAHTTSSSRRADGLPSPCRSHRAGGAAAGLLSLLLLALLPSAQATTPGSKAATQQNAGKGSQSAQRPRQKAPVVREDDAPDEVSYGGREDVLRFADETAARHGLDPAWVREQLAQARFQPSVTRFIMPPPAGTAKNWNAYRARFIEPIRLRAGRAFWAANESRLNEAEARYGVPPEIVVGIIGIETLYGRQMGNFRVIDALATLAFDFPSGRRDRSGFFRDELGEFLRMSHEARSDPLRMRGSFAGAMGMPQFMPSSVRQYAVDFDGDGRIDLHQSSADVIGSVAHYLARFGWQRGMPTHFPVAVPTDTSDRAALLAPDILPSFLASEFTARGARLPPEVGDEAGKLALVELQNGPAAPSYVAGTGNFYAITRYNWSSYYAMAVIELGAAIRDSR